MEKKEESGPRDMRNASYGDRQGVFGLPVVFLTARRRGKRISRVLTAWLAADKAEAAVAAARPRWERRKRPGREKGGLFSRFRIPHLALGNATIGDRRAIRSRASAHAMSAPVSVAAAAHVAIAVRTT